LEIEEDLSDLKIGSLAIMLSGDRSPHIDGMNPKGNEDLAIQFNFRISI
jgi:hypothetical protein